MVIWRQFLRIIFTFMLLTSLLCFDTFVPYDSSSNQWSINFVWLKTKTILKPSDNFHQGYWHPLTVSHTHCSLFKRIKTIAHLLIVFNKTLNISHTTFNDLVPRNTFLIPWRGLWSTCWKMSYSSSYLTRHMKLSCSGPCQALLQPQVHLLPKQAADSPQNIPWCLIPLSLCACVKCHLSTTFHLRPTPSSPSHPLQDQLSTRLLEGALLGGRDSVSYIL